MIRRLSWRPPVIAIGGFLLLALAVFKALGHSWAESSDAALSALAGVRPHVVNLGSAQGGAAVAVMAVVASGFVLRIFLIAYCAAYLVRRNLEKNEMRELLRLLQERSQGAAGRDSSTISHVGNLN